MGASSVVLVAGVSVNFLRENNMWWSKKKKEEIPIKGEGKGKVAVDIHFLSIPTSGSWDDPTYELIIKTVKEDLIEYKNCFFSYPNEMVKFQLYNKLFKDFFKDINSEDYTTIGYKYHIGISTKEWYKENEDRFPV